MTSPSFSPSSGAKAATKTRPTTFGAPVAALLITAPPYECPTARTGPGIWANTLATYALSCGDAAQRVGGGDHRDSVRLEALDDAGPAGAVGEGAVHEHDGQRRWWLSSGTW